MSNNGNKNQNPNSTESIGENTEAKAGAKTPEEIAKEQAEQAKAQRPEEQQKQKTETEKKRLEELRDKLNRSNLSDDTKKLANNAIDAGDEDEVALVEQLISRNIVMTQDEFKKKLEELREKKAKLKKGEELPDSETRMKVNKSVLNRIKETPPEKQKVNEKINRKLKKMETLNQRHADSVGEINKVLETYVKNQKISPEDADKLAKLDPTNPMKFEKWFDKLLGHLGSDEKLKKKLLRLKEEQRKIIDQYEEELADVKEMMEREAQVFYHEKARLERIRYLSHMTGVKVEEGKELEFLSLGSDLKRSKKRVRIDKVSYVTEDIPDDDDLRQKLEEDPELKIPKQLKIKIASDNPDGSTTSELLSEREFIEWMNAQQAVEVIVNKRELEQRIGFAEFGQQLKSGMELSYLKTRKSGGNPDIATVKVENIDEVKGTIRLNKPVVVLAASQTGEDPSLSSDRYKTELTFGEFSKWFSRCRAEEHMNLDKARKTVAQMPHILKIRYPNVTPDIWEFNDLPIEIKKGEKISFGDKKQTTIKEVTDDKVELGNGMSLTPSQFVRFVKEHEAEKAEKFKLKEDVKNKIEEAAKTETEGEKPKSKKEAPEDLPDVGEKIGPLGEIWAGINFLSIRDIAKIIDTSKEFFKRRFERNSKRRAAKAGSAFPGRWGIEFQNLTQTAENEEVNKYYEDMKQNDVWYIQDRMYNTQSTDEFKACINLLTEKGSFNFHSPRVWQAMNNILSVATNITPSDKENLWVNFTIPPGGSIDDAKPAENKSGRLPVDAVKEMMSALWGRPGGSDWYSANDSAYNGLVQKFTTDATDFENDYKNNGGIASELHNMLVKHAAGEYIEPYRYESFIKYIIDAGKAEIEDKIFYIVAGLACKNSRGEPLLTKQRMSSIDTLMNKLPHLDYLVRYKVNGQGERMPEEYIQELYEKFTKGKDLSKTNVAKKSDRYNYFEVRKFVWQDMMTHQEVQNRLNKAMRMAESMDHDDGHVLIPLADDKLIMNAVISNIRAQRSAFTIEGYANGFAGFTQRLRTLGQLVADSTSETDEKRKNENFQDTKMLMGKAIKAWLIYESSLSGRAKYGNYTILSKERLNQKPIVDSDKNVQEHLVEMREVVRKVLKAYKMPESDIRDFLDFSSSNYDDSVKKKHADKMRAFGDKFDKLISEDGGAKMVEVVTGSIEDGTLEGFRGEDLTSDKALAEQAKAKAESEAQAAAGEQEAFAGDTGNVSMADFIKQKQKDSIKNVKKEEEPEPEPEGDD